MKKWDLKGKRALVTGGTEVMIVARNGKEVEELVRLWQAGGRVVTGLAGDVSVEGDRRRIGAAVEERWGSLDVLVNNVGMNVRKQLVEYEPAEYLQIFDVNLFAAV